jgi:hypothetical protein
MSLSNNPGAYADCHEILNRALDDKSGVRIAVESYNAGIHLRMRLHQARELDRRENKKTYPDDHPMNNRSAWDPFVVRIKANDSGKHWVYIEPNVINADEIEALSTIEVDDTEVVRPVRQGQIDGPRPMLQIEHIRRRV